MTAMAMMDKTTTTIWRFMIIKLNIIVILWVMSMCSNQRTEARHDISRRRLSEPLLGRIVQTLCTAARQHPGASLSTRRVDHQLDINWPVSHQPHMRVSAPVSNATERVHYFAECHYLFCVRSNVPLHSELKTPYNCRARLVKHLFRLL